MSNLTEFHLTSNVYNDKKLWLDYIAYHSNFVVNQWSRIHLFIIPNYCSRWCIDYLDWIAERCRKKNFAKKNRRNWKLWAKLLNTLRHITEHTNRRAYIIPWLVILFFVISPYVTWSIVISWFASPFNLYLYTMFTVKLLAGIFVFLFRWISNPVISPPYKILFKFVNIHVQIIRIIIHILFNCHSIQKNNHIKCTITFLFVHTIFLCLFLFVLS